MPSDQDEDRLLWPAANSRNNPVDAGVQSGEQLHLFADNVDVDTADKLVGPAETDDLPEPALDSLASDPESDLIGWTQKPLISKETLTTFARQISPVLLPLPFALIIYGLIRLVTLSRAPFLPTLPTLLILLGLTIFQGTMLYLAGSNDTLWLLYIACGYALFLLAGVLAAFGPVAMLVMLVLLLVLGAVLARRGIHPIKEGHVELVEVFGKYTHTLYPGLNLLLPWEKVMQRYNTQEVTWVTPQMLVPISRNQDVQFKATVSYQLLPEDAHLAARLFRNWEESLRLLFVGTVQSVVNTLTPDDFLAWTQSFYSPTSEDGTSSFNPLAATRWDQINERLKNRLEDEVANWGVQVNWVTILDLTPLPHAPATASSATAAPLAAPTLKENDETLPAASTQMSALHPKSPASRPVLQELTSGGEQPEPAKVSSPPAQLASVETLRIAYNAVRDGKITHPATLLEIAQQFEALANNEQLNQTIDFDAARAAATLRERAQKLRELQKS